MREMSVNYASYAEIAKWKPAVGDFIVWHGWLTHWFGVVSAINDDSIEVIKAGLPSLLFRMKESEMPKSAITIKLQRIRNSMSGTFAIMQSKEASVWYV